MAFVMLASKALRTIRENILATRNRDQTNLDPGNSESPPHFGQQADGIYFCAVAQTRWGTIPGKEKSGECWYPYGGKEYRIDNGFSVFKEGVCVSSRNEDIIPLGFQSDGVGELWCALAETRFGRVPGKANASSCWYSYGGREYSTSQFWFVGPSRSATRVGVSPLLTRPPPNPIFPPTISPESILPEYRASLAKICVSVDIMQTSEIYENIAALRAFQCEVDNHEELYARIVAKAFALSSASAGRDYHGRVLVTDDSGVDLQSHFFRDICEFARGTVWETSALNAALDILLRTEDQDGLQVREFVLQAWRQIRSHRVNLV